MFSVLHEIIFQRYAILFIKWTQNDPRSAYINERYILSFPAFYASSK